MMIPLLALAVVQLTSACAAVEMRICTGSTSYEGIFKPLAMALETKAGLKIIIPNEISSQGAVDHVRSLLEGKCEAAIANIGFEEWMKLAADAGSPVDKKRLTYRTIGREFIKIIVNKGLGIHSLTMAQLDRLFSGQIKTWKELGGPDVPVRVTYAKSKSSTSKTFSTQVLGGKGIKADAIPLSYEEVVQNVVKNAGGIGFVAQAIPIGSAVEAKTEREIGRPKVMLSVGKPSENAVKLIEFLRSEEARKR